MVTKITMNDIEALTKLFVNVFNGTPWKEQWTHRTANKRLQDVIHTPGFRGMVLYEGKELSGLVMGKYEQNYDGVNFQVMEFCIAPSKEKEEVGKELLLELSNSLRKDNVKNIYFNVKKDEELETLLKQFDFIENEEIVKLAKRV